MTDINTRGKLPFAVVSSSVTTGYAAELTSSVGYNIDIVNHHKDEYGGIENSPLQGPFTNQHVGGNQHRHVKLNEGTDNSDNRPEGYIISSSINSIKVYGPDLNGAHKPRAILTRGNTAKSPINISNIQTSGNIAGNFEHNYQVVQSVGRRATNNLIVDGFEASGSLTTQFVTGTSIYSLPDITRIDASGKQYKDKTTFVQRFNAPGGREESSRGALDREGEEYSPNNSLTTRNIKVRQPYYNQLTQHSAQFNSGSTYKLLPGTGSVIATTIHAINRNTLQKIVFTGSSPSTGSRYDNFWVQHAIPATDLRYKWIADSISSSQQPIEYQSYNLPYSTSSLYNSNGTFNDLSFELTGAFGDHLGISGAIDKDEMFVSTYTNTMYRDRKYFNFTSSNDFYIDASDISSDISSKDFSLSFWLNIPEDTSIGRNLESLNFIDSSSVLAQENGPTGMFIDSSGVRLFVIGVQADSVHQYSLSTAWDITSKTFVRSLSVTLDEGVPTGLFFKSDGTRMYVVGSNNSPRTLKQYNLGTAWDISTVGAASTFSFGAIAIPQDLFISPDGTKMFIVRSDGDVSTEYDLLTPWDATTAVFVRTVAIASTTPVGSHTGISFSHDGRYMYILRNETLDSQDDIFMYYLPNAWSLLGATLVTSKNIGDKLNIPRGMFVKPDDTTRMYVIGDMGADSLIYQFSLNNIFDLINYSGSASDNYLKAAFSQTSSYLYVNGSDADNDILIKQRINDSLWHNITLVSDVSTAIRRMTTFNGSVISTPQNTTVTKIYVDGALVTETTQLYKKLDISKLIISAGRYGQANSSAIDEISVWQKVLSEKEVNEIFKVSKSAYGKQPKKYIEHKFDNINIPTPIHIYSTRINEDNLTLIDEVGNKDVELVNFTSSVNIRPQNSGIISYSTYFNGPYQASNWKFIRNNEHPITRKLTTENTNIVSTLIPEGSRVITRNINGIPVRITLPGSRKQGTLLNIKESPVYANNKPLKHRFILKDSTDQNVGFEITHTYANNLQYFANKELNDVLGLNKKERQIYDTLLEYYNGTVDENENPIEKLVGYTYSETILPKLSDTGLKETRMRTDYMTEQPGFSVDGYDRQLGTQRAFWRDSQEDRMRTRRNYITSLGEQVESVYNLPFQTPSMAALEYVTESSAIEYIKNDRPGPLLESILDLSYQNSAELNSNQIFTYHSYGYLAGAARYGYYTMPANQTPEVYFFKNALLTGRDDDYNTVLASGMYPLQSTNDPSSLRAYPSYFYKHCTLIVDRIGVTDTTTLVYNNNTHDLGLNRLTEKISGKNPWYDSYEDYYVDVKALSNDDLVSYSKIPEFKISDEISNLIMEYSGDIAKITLQKYVDDLQFSYIKLVDSDNSEMAQEDTISIIVNGVKKLLPYNGFYPQDRSLQLVNYLKQSYLDTNAIGGGLLLTGSLDEYMFREENDKLTQFMKESAFLEPLYAPGIFYNLIKSGIAVDWSIFTGSVPRSPFIVPLLKKPEYKISFESLLNLQNIPLSSSNQSSENRMMKHKEIGFSYDASDYGLVGAYNFQGFFEKLSEGSPLYTLSINNFLAETINFFLKDSVLNTFISKPDSDFLSFDSDKTYYMDIILRKNDIVMCEAHSSSLADNFGRMSGRYFGPAFWSGSNADASAINTNFLLSETLRDPAYCTYAPPYYYGDSIARISFKPSITKKYTLDEIFEDIEIQFMNTSFMNNSIYASGSLYSSIAMPLASSVTIKGQIENRQQTVQLENLSQNFSNTVTRSLRNLVGTATNSTGIKKWVISPKMEVPVLDFSNQEFITSTTILTQSNTDLKLKNEPGFIHTPPTASGFGRGMWSGYGEIPEGNKGIFLELRESYPRELVSVLNPDTRQFGETNTGSLLQACGFQSANDKLSKKIGELADSRDISEAIIIIPYVERASTGKNIRFGGGFSTLTVNDTVEIEGHNFIKINQNIFNYQKTNVLANKPAVSLADFSRGVGNIQETSISRMIGLMNKYVLPPNFDFLLNESVEPFVMYIAEFTSKLDKQDLADIWQGVMPKIAIRAEREKSVISHKNTQFDFFHGQGLPSDVKFLIFKAKKRAEINYYKMTADSSDDGLFPSIQAGKPPSPYSFNWPYDYCSLVETAKVDVEIEYVNISGSNNT
jgi:hypothetical protein